MSLTVNTGVVTTVISTAATLRKKFVLASGAQAGANARAIGVTLDEVDAAGKPLPVCISGTAFVLSGAAVTLGADVTSDASGRAIAAGANPVNGIALDAATGADETIRIRIV